MKTDDGFIPTGILIPKTKDGRVIFVLNWEHSIIAGTTDLKEEKDKLAVHTHCRNEGVQEIAGELRDMFNVNEIEISSKWAGHRPLVKAKGDSKSLARSHEIEKDEYSGLISILGGKWTIFRKMGEETVDLILEDLKDEGHLTEAEFNEKMSLSTRSVRFLGDFREQIFDINTKQDMLKKIDYNKIGIDLLKNKFPNKDLQLIKKLYLSYGMRSEMILEEINNSPSKAEIIEHASLLTRAEIEHIVKYEYTTNVSDIIMRRLRIAFTNRERSKK